jgi:NADH-quinone oxidoreductase subunit G
LDVVKQKLGSALESHGANQLGVLASPSSTLEELYLLQKIARAVGTNNIDARLRQVDFSDQNSVSQFPWLGTSIADLETLQSALLIGSNVRKEQPIINHRLRKAALKGAAIMMLNPVDYDFNYPVETKTIVAPEKMPMELAAILKALIETTGQSIDEQTKQCIDNIDITDAHRKMADKLANADDAIVLLGNIATAHPHFSLLRSLAGLIAKHSNSKIGYLSEAANSSGVWLSGVLPHRLAGGVESTNVGLNTHAMLQEKLKAYVLMGVEPEMDCWDSRAARTAMNEAELVISLTAYRSDEIEKYADVMLPVSVFAETSGTFINNAGSSQTFAGVVPPVGQARPAWKFLRVLGNLFNLDGFDYESSSDVLDEVMQSIGEIKTNNMDQWQE